MLWYLYVATDDTSQQITALAQLVASMKCTAERDTDRLCYLYQQYDVCSSNVLFVYTCILICMQSPADCTFLQVTETPERVCNEAPMRNSPRIASFIGDELQQYFVVIEQKVLCQVPSFQFAMFVLFSAYYICFSFGVPETSEECLKAMYCCFLMVYVDLLCTLLLHLTLRNVLLNLLPHLRFEFLYILMQR